MAQLKPPVEYIIFQMCVALGALRNTMKYCKCGLFNRQKRLEFPPIRTSSGDIIFLCAAAHVTEKGRSASQPRNLHDSRVPKGNKKRKEKKKGNSACSIKFCLPCSSSLWLAP